MNRKTALSFLEANQPFPQDAELTTTDLNELDEVRKFFAENPDRASVRLFLNVFGDGDGFGVYQLIEGTVLKQDRKTVVAELLKSLTSPHPSVRYWCAQIASSFPDESVVESLILLLEGDDFDTKYAVLTTLEQVGELVPKRILAAYAEGEKEEELRELAEVIINKPDNTQP